ncbi:MAG: sugar ABC transporter permease [Sphaerochaetaceae bacterium]|nr:sugar ABC transporter permease [Sphaerochaetaceae bacterium]
MSKSVQSLYTYTFLLPAGVIYALFFLAPTFLSFFYSLTIWTLSEWRFTGLDNFAIFLSEPSLVIGFRNTLVYATVSASLKVVLGFLLAAFLTSELRTKGFLRSLIYFPNIVSTIAVGIMFSSFLHPSKGIVNVLLALIGIDGPDWLGNPSIALLSVALVDVWKGVGIAMVIFIAGIQAIDRQYYEAARIDGASSFDALRHITLPLSRSSMNTVIMLAFIGGLRSFDLIWVMTKGGPGFTTDLVASIIYKQFQGGFYGIATAGNVILFLIVSAFAIPLYRIITKKEVDL